MAIGNYAFQISGKIGDHMPRTVFGRTPGRILGVGISSIENHNPNAPLRAQAEPAGQFGFKVEAVFFGHVGSAYNATLHVEAIYEDFGILSQSQTQEVHVFDLEVCRATEMAEATLNLSEPLVTACITDIQSKHPAKFFLDHEPGRLVCRGGFMVDPPVNEPLKAQVTCTMIRTEYGRSPS